MLALLRRACLALLLPLILVSPALAAPALWHVADADSEIWLFGSIHSFDTSTKWRTPALNKAIKAADLVYFEIPLKASEQELVAALAKLGFNKGGKLLSDYLSQAQRVKLAAAIVRLRLDPMVVQLMRPWAAAMVLSGGGAGEGRGLRLKPGVEAALAREIPDRKERGFDTLETQLRVFADLSSKQQVRLLMESLEPPGDDRAAYRQVATAWLDGDIDALYRMSLEALGKPGSEWYNAMLTSRNKRWASQIATLLKTDQDIVVVVGAGHFAGPTGLPALLAKKGIKLERVQ